MLTWAGLTVAAIHRDITKAFKNKQPRSEGGIEKSPKKEVEKRKMVATISSFIQDLQTVKKGFLEELSSAAAERSTDN